MLDAQALDLDALRALPIANGPTGPIPLRTVADVIDGAEDPDVIVSRPRGEAVALSVARLARCEHAAMSSMACCLRSRSCARAMRFPPMSTSCAVYDQAELVDESLASVRDAILIGIVLSLARHRARAAYWRAGLVAALPFP